MSKTDGKEGEELDSEVSVFVRVQTLTATARDQDESKTFTLAGVHSLGQSRGLNLWGRDRSHLDQFEFSLV